MRALAFDKKKYSLEEYFEMENVSPEKHEYYRGEIFDMAGAKVQHNIVTKNILVALAVKLDDSPCQPFNSNTRIYIEKNSLVTYPDVSVVCDVITLNDDEYNVMNPSVIFEISSTSTEKYNRNDKFRLYRDIPTLREFVLIKPDIVCVEAFHINGQGFWELREYNNINEILELYSIGISLALIEIYKRTKALSQLKQH